MNIIWKEQFLTRYFKKIWRFVFEFDLRRCEWQTWVRKNVFTLRQCKTLLHYVICFWVEYEQQSNGKKLSWIRLVVLWIECSIFFIPIKSKYNLLEDKCIITVMGLKINSVMNLNWNYKNRTLLMSKYDQFKEFF